MLIFSSFSFTQHKKEKEKKISESEIARVLSQEITEDILLRLPANEALRFGCTSKSSYKLVREPSFVKRHLDRWKGKTSSRLLLQSHAQNRFYSYDHDSQNKTLTEVSLPFGREHCSILGSCKGLVCLSSKQSGLHLWNPLTGEVRHVPDTEITANSYFQSFGFGYNATLEDYQVIRATAIADVTKVELYSLRENSWRRFKGLSYNIRNSKCGVFLGGCETQAGECIVAYDMASEDFRVMPLPDHRRGEDYNPSTLLTLDGLHLSLLVRYESRCVVWSLTDIWHWSFQFRVDEFWMPVWDQKNDVYLVSDHDGRLVQYDFKVGKLIGVGLRGSFRDATVCEESLVRLDAGDEEVGVEQVLSSRKRKRLEEEQLLQNMDRDRGVRQHRMPRMRVFSAGLLIESK